MTGYSKIAISLPPRAAEHVRRAVKAGRAASVSAYVATAIEDRAKREDLAALLDEMLAETGGPMTASERRAADRALGVADGPRRKPRRPRR
jgi:Arc/MetJ-type ribon-helix-helix transcriptional regulator